MAEGNHNIEILDVYNGKDSSLSSPTSDIKQKHRWRKFFSYVGPGFLVSLAYLDPGNLETDLQAGANHRYELLWVILIGLIFALIIQSLAANLGVSTGKHLAELCNAEYPNFVKYLLWLLAEIAVIAADIPQVIGTAFAMNILFRIPVWGGVLLTGFTTLLLLGLQRHGVRKLEMVITLMVLVMAACFFGEMSFVKPSAANVLKGMFIPKLNGHGATGDAIALLGALIMPHNLFLHSAMVLSRKIPNSVNGVNDACRYFLIESGIALSIAFLINVSVISVSGTICSSKNLPNDSMEKCQDLSLNSASFLLKNVLGKSSSIVYGIALLASGQSSAISGTYAGQYIMQGFLELKMKTWIRNMVTRCIAIAPSLIVSIICGPSGAGQLIIIASMILSFELPFALIPLLKFSSNSTKMGPHKNSKYITRSVLTRQVSYKIIVMSWILGLGIMGINIYYLTTGFVNWLTQNNFPLLGNVFIGIILTTGFVNWLTQNNFPLLGNVFIGIIVFPLMLVYIIAVAYLMFRKDAVVTFVAPTKPDPGSSLDEVEPVP